MGTKNEIPRIVPERIIVQNESMLSVGNAMSRAPIMSGMQKFPNAPMRIGVMAKKIMIVPCIVKNDVYDCGGMTPPLWGQMSWPRTGNGVPGSAICQRIIIAITPPTARKKRPYQTNCFAMTLWSEEKMYFPRKLD